MPRNVEIKARIYDFAAIQARAEQLSDTPVEILHQRDIFYLTSKGRLKLRVLAPDRCELIQYSRADSPDAKPSEYYVVRSSDPVAFARILESVLPVRGTVVKRRLLYRRGPTRIHLDDVQDLGFFLELEVVLSETQTSQYGADIADELMNRLGIPAEDRVSGAYIDLLENRA